MGYSVESNTSPDTLLPGSQTEISETDAGKPTASARAHIWRLHFYVGILVAPLLVLSSLSGILYVFFPQVEEGLYMRLYRVTPETNRPALDYDAQLRAVSQAYPSARVRVFTPSTSPTRSSAVTVGLPEATGSGNHSGHEGHGEHSDHGAGSKPQSKETLTTVYLHPQTGNVIGTLVEEDRYRTVIKRAHKTFLAGENGRILTELGASWLMVLLLTGIYLWFPRKVRQITGVWLPRFTGASRLRWRDWHSILGVYFLLMTLALTFTGITWTRFAGEYRRAFQKAIGQQSAFMIKPPPSTLVEGATPIRLSAAVTAAESAGITSPYKVTMPSGPKGCFAVQTYDDPPFHESLTVFVDQYSGQVLQKRGRDDTPPVARFLGMGVALHEGRLFGLANQILCALAAGMVIFSVVSGLVMWLKRRPAGGFGAPRSIPGSRVSWPLLLVFAVLCVLLPTVGVSFALLLVFDRFLLPRLVTKGTSA